MSSITAALQESLQNGYVFELDIQHKEIDDTKPEKKKAILYKIKQKPDYGRISNSTEEAIIGVLKDQTAYIPTQDAKNIRNLEWLGHQYGAIRIEYGYFGFGKDQFQILLNQRLGCPRVIHGNTLEEALEEALASARK